MRGLKALICGIFAAGISHAANAAAIYDYNGANFTTASLPLTTGEHISGSVAFSTIFAPSLNNVKLAPTAFSLSDGANTFTNITVGGNTSGFFVTTDALGNISKFSFAVSDGLNGLDFAKNDPQLGTGDQAYSCGALVQGSCLFYGTANNSVAGSLTLEQTAVPEPLTVAMFGAGLAGAAALRRRKKAKKA